MSNFQFIIKSPIYLYIKKHCCPHCGQRLKVAKVSRIIHPGSYEAKQLKMDFSMAGGVYQNGNVKVIWHEFECPKCNCRITVDQMKEIEKR